MNTHATILERADITPPDDLLANIEVPVLSGPQRQGDVGIWPRPKLGKAEHANMRPILAEGVAVVRGEATGNTHLLLADGAAMWAPLDDDLTLGVLHIPEGAVAWLIHTDEHGVNGIAAGTYRLTGKREQAAGVRRVAD